MLSLVDVLETSSANFFWSLPDSPPKLAKQMKGTPFSFGDFLHKAVQLSLQTEPLLLNFILSSLSGFLDAFLCQIYRIINNCEATKACAKQFFLEVTNGIQTVKDELLISLEKAVLFV